ncbi:HesB/YadR/YfhF family protein [Bacillus sp. REN10]|uniref:HesB/YadR/YfhF family protein n=1 Tax=Bacillus sp. REN10 TaxID=2782541 RepID=UPI00193B7211|nr:HesB/YadR/YfhF family protein [Bacillus sp. REN10]
MNIIIHSEALSWFKQEVDVQSGEFIRFFVRYGGSSPLHDSFSLGLTKEEPIEIGAKKEYDGIVFFVEQKDLWFFDGHDLHVHYNQKLDEPEYTYVKPE